MKKCILIILILIFGGFSYGQSIKYGNSSTNIVVKTNILHYFLSTYYYSLEVKLANNQSAQFSVYYIDNRGSIANLSSQSIQENFSGWGGTFEWRFYLQNNSTILGSYLSPYIKFHDLKIVRENPYGGNPAFGPLLFNDRTKTSFGLVIGKQKRTKIENLLLDFHFGLGYSLFNESNFKGNLDNYKDKLDNPIEIRLGLCIGIG